MKRHGHFGTPEYHCWAHIIQRCENPKNRGFKNYGGRGIQVCDRWRQSFRAFLDDVGYRPSASHMLDRMNNNGDYTPNNCRWVTRAVQNRNRRITQRVTWQGRTMTLAEWASVLGFSYTTLQMRLLRHWPLDRAFTEALGRGRFKHR